MKDCAKCGNSKPTHYFGKNVAKEDGLQSYCFVCMRKYQREHSKRKPAGWTRKTADIVAYRVAYRKKNKERIARLKSNWMKAHPERERVKGAVRYAIKTGKIVRLPCQICGEEKSHAHHPSYDLPLDVVWLCRVHHSEAHA